MEGLVESASIVVIGILLVTLAFLCLFYLLKIFPQKTRDGDTSDFADGLETMDTQQYEDLKMEYMRRKMAMNIKSEEKDVALKGTEGTNVDEETTFMNSITVPGGTSTGFTDRNEDGGDGRGVFGRAYDLLFSDKENENEVGSGGRYRHAEEIQLSRKDLM